VNGHTEVRQAVPNGWGRAGAVGMVPSTALQVSCGQMKGIKSPRGLSPVDFIWNVIAVDPSFMCHSFGDAKLNFNNIQVSEGNDRLCTPING